jgi:hypothetical protein
MSCSFYTVFRVLFGHMRLDRQVGGSIDVPSSYGSEVMRIKQWWVKVHTISNPKIGNRVAKVQNRKGSCTEFHHHHPYGQRPYFPVHLYSPVSWFHFRLTFPLRYNDAYLVLPSTIRFKMFSSSSVTVYLFHSQQQSPL